jgi:predicted PurR-regulated permease PerM
MIERENPRPAPHEGLDLRWQWLILLLVLGGIVYLLSPVLMPFVAAALFAYLADPVVDRLERWMGRSFAVTLVFLVVIVILVVIVLLLVPFIERQIGSFLAQLPIWVDWFQTRATPWLEARFGISPDILDTTKILDALRENWKEAGGFAATVLGRVSKSGVAVVGWMLNLVMIPVVAFYLLRDWDVLVARIAALIPRSIAPVATRMITARARWICASVTRRPSSPLSRTERTICSNAKIRVRVSSGSIFVFALSASWNIAINIS